MDNSESSERSTIAIVGTGLIGCSMAEGLRDISSEIIGVDNNTGHLQEALYRGWIDRSMSLEKAAGNADIIIISVPVDVSIQLLPRILELMAPCATVIDAGSIKGAVCRITRDHLKRKQFVAAHPMAGLAVSGPEASDSGIFRNKKVIICEKEKSSEAALKKAYGIFNKLGMDIVYMDPDLHDLCVARVSHLPQVLAYILAALSAGEDKHNESMLNIASTGYESATRLASSPADVWIPVFKHNRANLSESLDEMISSLSGLRDMIKEGRWKSLENQIEKANKSRELFMSVYK
jgi:prephenate dehydrogenase